MAKTLDLERHFFKVAKNLETRKEVKETFIKEVTEASEKWIDNKLRFRIMGLK